MVILLPDVPKLPESHQTLFVHHLWKLEAIVVIHNECHTALAGLTVDSNNRLVLPSEIGWIDRQIRNFPVWGLSLLQCMDTFVDGILM